MENAVVNAKITLKFINQGWYYRDNFIKKKMVASTVPATCYSCFAKCLFDVIRFSKIIYLDKERQLFNIYCICEICSDTILNDNKISVKAPANLKEVWEYLVKHNQLCRIVEDFRQINNASTEILDSAIEYSKFNYNEKLAILNNLKNENAILANNLDIEIEKNQILNEQIIKNTEAITRIREQFRNFSKELLKDNHKNIKEHIDRLTELNNFKKYSVPECKVCMANEVKIALQCGHLLCKSCYDGILKNTDKSQYECEDNDIKDVDIIECPTCRTISTLSVNIYF